MKRKILPLIMILYMSLVSESYLFAENTMTAYDATAVVYKFIDKPEDVPIEKYSLMFIKSDYKTIVKVYDPDFKLAEQHRKEDLLLSVKYLPVENPKVIFGDHKTVKIIDVKYKPSGIFGEKTVDGQKKKIELPLYYEHTKVQFIESDKGSFYGLISRKRSKKYPMNLNDEFNTNGLYVVMTYCVSNTEKNSYDWGDNIIIKEMIKDTYAYGDPDICIPPSPPEYDANGKIVFDKKSDFWQIITDDNKRFYLHRLVDKYKGNNIEVRIKYYEVGIKFYNKWHKVKFPENGTPVVGIVHIETKGLTKQKNSELLKRANNIHQ